MKRVLKILQGFFRVVVVLDGVSTEYLDGAF